MTKHMPETVSHLPVQFGAKDFSDHLPALYLEDIT
jgi:hypothetical protein